MILMTGYVRINPGTQGVRGQKNVENCCIRKYFFFSDPSVDTTLMMNMYRSYINTLLAEESKDNTKAMALQEIWDNFDVRIQFNLSILIHSYFKYLSILTL
jgi:hypothetical protein